MKNQTSHTAWPCLRAAALASAAAALVALASGCGNSAQTEDSPSEQIRWSLEEIYEAFDNGDVPRLEDLVSDQCSAKDQMLEAAGFMPLLFGGEISYELPQNMIQLETAGPDHVIARPNPEGDTPKLNGIRLNEIDPDGELSFEYEFVNEDGAWRLLDCDDKDFNPEF
jgi:hypothetical protein